MIIFWNYFKNLLGILPQLFQNEFFWSYFCLRYFRKFSQLCIQALQLLNVHAGTVETSSPLDVRHFTASCDMSRKWVATPLDASSCSSCACRLQVLPALSSLWTPMYYSDYHLPNSACQPASRKTALSAACGHPKGVSTPTWSYTGLFCLVLLYVYDVLSVVHIQKYVCMYEYWVG